MQKLRTMNIIQKQADEFTQNKMRVHLEHKEFIENVRLELNEYKKTVYKIEFVERIIHTAKKEYDHHLKSCTTKDCGTNKFYENTLFFLQEELEELESELTPADFIKEEKESLNKTLEIILNDVNLLKLGQQITYDDFKEEFEELKDLYYLNKKNWVHMLVGKLIFMTASGIITGTISKELLEIINSNYENLIGN